MPRRYTDKTKAEIGAEAVAGLARFQARVNAAGATPDERLLRLGELLQRDLADAAARVRAADQLNGLLIHHYQAWGSSVNAIRKHGLQHLITEDEAPTIQTELREVLGRLMPGDPVFVDVPISDGVVWDRDRGVRLVTRTAGLPQVLAAVVDLLISIGPRLRRCKTPDCQKLFATKRPAQIHCTTKCARRVARARMAPRRIVSATRRRNTNSTHGK